MHEQPDMKDMSQGCQDSYTCSTQAPLVFYRYIDYESHNLRDYTRGSSQVTTLKEEV